MEVRRRDHFNSSSFIAASESWQIGVFLLFVPSIQVNLEKKISAITKRNFKFSETTMECADPPDHVLLLPYTQHRSERKRQYKAVLGILLHVPSVNPAEQHPARARMSRRSSPGCEPPFPARCATAGQQARRFAGLAGPGGSCWGLFSITGKGLEQPLTCHRALRC